MNSFYCAAPWRGLHINPRGDIKTCCAGDPNMLGNLNTQTIDQILHGPVMQEIRQTLQQGRPHEQYCHNCVQAERHGPSERNWHNGLNPGFDAKTATDQEHVPVLIDVRWNTTCNLSCNYCGDKCSSKWAGLKGISVASGTRPYIEQVCEYLQAHKSSIRQVALVGGEPLLLKENQLMLDVIPPTCHVNLITNLSVKLDSNQIFQTLRHRSGVGWNVSVDNIGPRFEYVRHGAKWNLLEENIAQVKLCAGHEIGIHAVYNLYNATRLWEFVDWTKQQGLSITWQSLFQPEYLDPLKLGPAIQELARTELDRVLSRTDLTPNERSFLSGVSCSAQHPQQVNLTEDFKQHIHQIENQYHLDQQGKFGELWPEISNTL
jgi:MoaA/NifB/PqqE/SkfB family radical SAM enzyme